MDENPNKDKKNELKSGKSIRSVIDDREKNTIFVKNFCSNNNTNNNSNSEKRKSCLTTSTKSLFNNNFKFKKIINSSTLSEIPQKIAHSSSRSDLGRQTYKLSLLRQMKCERNSCDSESLLGKKYISNTSLSLKNNYNNNTNNNYYHNSNNSNLNALGFSNNIKFKSNKNNIYNDFQRESSKNIFKSDSNNNLNNNSKNNNNNNNKNLLMNQSCFDKSGLEEIENKTNNYVFLKTNYKANSLKRSSTPITVRDEIFSDAASKYKNNIGNSDLKKSSMKKMNSIHGISFNSKNNNQNFDYFKKDDFYYSAKFHA